MPFTIFVMKKQTGTQISRYQVVENYQNTKAIVVINPNNPTGALYPDEILLEIVEIARQNNLIIFADEICDGRLVMDGEKHGCAS